MTNRSRFPTIVETAGWVVSVVSTGIFMYAAISQQFVPSRITYFYWNKYNEGFIEYLLTLFGIPCVTYYIISAFQRMSATWRK